MSDLPPPPPPPSLPPIPPNMAPPPGYVAYGGYGAATGQFQRIRSLGKWLVVLLAITLATQALTLVVQIALHGSAQDFVGEVNRGRFDDQVGLFVTVSLLATVATIAEMVVLIIWSFRIAKNLQVLGRVPQSFGPGATIAVNILGGCTLGILNFFMWRELWRGSDPDTAPGDPSWKRLPVSPLVPLHLGLGLAGIVAGFSLGLANGFSVQVGDSTEDLAEQFGDKLAATVATGLLGIAASVVFLIFVRQLTERHMAATREP